MKQLKITLISIVVLVIIFLLMGPFFTVNEGELAIVKRFDKIIRTETEAGLKLKLPFVDKIAKFPKKIQSWDGEATRVPTEENQFIWVDTTARWRISDPKLFYSNVATLSNAQGLLDGIIDSNVRKVISRNLLREAIRNSNIINEIERKNVFEAQSSQDESSQTIDILSAFTLTDFKEIEKGREKLSVEMFNLAKSETPEGIELIDIIIRQIKYSDDLTQSVYNRMIKERKQIAQAFRSAGEGEKAKLLGQMEKELRTIRSDAERQAKEIRAKADAEALLIRNRAYSQNPEFAEFWMAMVQYEKLLPKMKKILTTDLDFFKYLHKKTGR